MRILLSILTTLALVTGSSADELKAGGVGAATQLLPKLFSSFADGSTKLEVVPSLGSSGALRALSQGALDIVVTGRPLSPDEIKSGMSVVATIQTPFLLVTSHPAPNAIPRSRVAELVADPKASWDNGERLRLILRPKSDSDTGVWIANFPGVEAALETARARQDVPTAATDQDAVDMAERIQGSLVGTTLLQYVVEDRKLSKVSIDGIAPTFEAFESGKYPFYKTIHFVLPEKKKASAERFIGFVKSAAGRDLLRQSGALLVQSSDRVK